MGRGGFQARMARARDEREADALVRLARGQFGRKWAYDENGNHNGFRDVKGYTNVKSRKKPQTDVATVSYADFESLYTRLFGKTPDEVAAKLFANKEEVTEDDVRKFLGIV